MLRYFYNNEINMRYYREIQRFGFDAESFRSDGSTTKIYLLKNGKRVRKYYEENENGMPVYYHVNVKSREGALLNFKYCRESSAAHLSMKELLSGIPELVRRNNEWIEREINNEKIRLDNRICELESLKEGYQPGQDTALLS